MAGQQPDRSIRVDTGDSDSWLRGRFRAMASPCELLCETDDAARAAELTNIAAAEAWRIEDKFSRYLGGSIVSQINSAGGQPVTLDAETAQIIDFARTLYELSDRSFDITSGVLRHVWTFDGSDCVPARGQVAPIMEKVGWHRVSWQPPVLQMPAGMEIDLGGIGKEYAVDRASSMLRERAAVSCLVNFGGDLAVTAAPQRFGHWKVGIEAVATDASIPSSMLNLRVGALATSGDARRFLLRDGVRYSHILDPRTGWPVPGAPRSITVAADTCTQAGMLSTLAMLKGEGAEAFLDAEGVRHWCHR